MGDFVLVNSKLATPHISMATPREYSSVTNGEVDQFCYHVIL